MTAGITSIADHPSFRKQEVVSSEGDILGFTQLLFGMDRFERAILLSDQNNFYSTFSTWMGVYDVELWSRLDHQWAINFAWQYLTQLSISASKDNGPCLSQAVLYAALFLGAQVPLAHLASCDHCAFMYDSLALRLENLELIESAMCDSNSFPPEDGSDDFLLEDPPPEYPGAS